MKKQDGEEKRSAEGECKEFKSRNEELITRNLVLERKLREKDVLIAGLNSKLEDGKKTIEGNWNKVSDAATNLRHTMNQNFSRITNDNIPERVTMDFKDSSVIFFGNPEI
jgi:hypothetical protein